MVKLQVLCKDTYDLMLSGDIYDPKTLAKVATNFNNLARNTAGDQSIAELVKEYLTAGRGVFFTRDMNQELGLKTRTDKKAADMALRRLEEKGLVSACGDKRGCWRPVQSALVDIDWKNSDPGAIIDLAWPLNLQRHFKLYPTNVCVIAGEKNSGKTAFCLDLAYLNADRVMPIHYFSSEMWGQELRTRIDMFPSQVPFEKIHFHVLDSETMADVVQPDAINIMDFLEVEDEFWMVARKIRKAFQKLAKGILIVCIQKDPDSKYGRGKAFSLEKSRVYITLTKKQTLTLEEVKNWQGPKNPNGFTYPYTIEQGMIRLKPKPGGTDAKHSQTAPVNGTGQKGLSGRGFGLGESPGPERFAGQGLPVSPDS